MIGILGWDTGGTLEVRQRILLRIVLGFLNAALHITDGVQVLVHLRPVAGSELTLQTYEIVLHPVEQ